MMNKSTLFSVPSGHVPITVKLINPVNAGPAILDRFMAPSVPGLDTFSSFPSLCFLLEHPSGRKLVWDLGIRKDHWNYAPKIAEYIPSTKYKIDVEKNVVDILEEHGVHGEDVEAVIWSHWHWDHIGDPSTFPPSTDLIVGPGFKAAMLPGAPANPEAPILENDHAGRNLREITFNGPNSTTIGHFKAFDYFGDGSFFLLDSPGHAIGHLCGLARTTTGPDTFILLGGDVCHFAGIFRPSTHLPIPDTIVPNPNLGSDDVGFCPGSAWEELQSSRGREPTQSLYDPTFGHDIPLAKRTIEKLQEADVNPDIFVIIAHDAQVRDGVPHFPDNLNMWKEAGWGRNLKWAFLKVLDGYWREKGLV